MAKNDVKNAQTLHDLILLASQAVGHLSFTNM